jgi:putative endonuclease
MSRSYPSKNCEPMTPRQPTERGLARRKVGIDGEAYAGRWYATQGYDIIERNWRCAEGEIDLIVRNGSVVVFCEVKTRSSDRFGTGFEAVTVAKQKRLRLLAARWLRETTVNGMESIRFDVASVMNGEITVVENAF